MFAVIYRFRVIAGREEQFEEGWSRVTRAIIERCGGYGSRLHRAPDGTYVAYARWPDEATRAACFEGPPPDPEGGAMMRDATEEQLPELPLHLHIDLLAEP